MYAEIVTDITTRNSEHKDTKNCKEDKHGPHQEPVLNSGAREGQPVPTS